MDYSIFRGAKELLYIPLSYDAKYRAKELIDVFAYRFGKGAASLIALFFGRFSALGTAIYPALGVLTGVIWLVSAFNFNHEKSSVKNLSRDAERQEA